MSSCNVVFGRTGCGKTSLKNMLCGEEPEDVSFTSGTSEAQVLPVSIDGKPCLYVDTAGILDNRKVGEGGEADSRADKVNKIGALLKYRGLVVSRVFYCVAATEKILKEEIDWLADVIQMLGGQQVMQCFAVVLTKVDAGYSKKLFQRDFDKMDNVKVLKAAFANCPIVTSGYDNLDEVKKLLVPAQERHAFVVEPISIKIITPKADLETQLAQTQAKLATVMKALQGTSTENIQAEIRGLENDIDDMVERITNAGWWCPGAEIDKASKRIRECRSIICDLKRNERKTDDDIKKYELQKLKLLDAVRDAELELVEKRNLGAMFLRLVVR